MSLEPKQMSKEQLNHILHNVTNGGEYNYDWAAEEIWAHILYLERENEALRKQLKEGCTCGSGGHPRKCARHPGAFDRHCEELNMIARDEEQAERIAELEAWLEGKPAAPDHGLTDTQTAEVDQMINNGLDSFFMRLALREDCGRLVITLNSEEDKDTGVDCSTILRAAVRSGR